MGRNKEQKGKQWSERRKKDPSNGTFSDDLALAIAASELTPIQKVKQWSERRLSVLLGFSDVRDIVENLFSMGNDEERAECILALTGKAHLDFIFELSEKLESLRSSPDKSFTKNTPLYQKKTNVKHTTHSEGAQGKQKPSLPLHDSVVKGYRGMFASKTGKLKSKHSQLNSSLLKQHLNSTIWVPSSEKDIVSNPSKLDVLKDTLQSTTKQQEKDYGVNDILKKHRSKDQDGAGKCKTQATALVFGQSLGGGDGGKELSKQLVGNCNSCGYIIFGRKVKKVCPYCHNNPQDLRIFDVVDLNDCETKVEALVNLSTQDSNCSKRSIDDEEMAISHRDRLIDFDQTDAARSRIIDDDVSDFIDSSSSWLSGSQRQQAAKRAQAELQERREYISRRSIKLKLGVKDADRSNHEKGKKLSVKYDYAEDKKERDRLYMLKPQFFAEETNSSTKDENMDVDNPRVRTAMASAVYKNLIG